MKLEFSYLEKGGQYFPVVEITLSGSQNEITLKALVDSGASFSVFRAEIAHDLGINIEKGKPVYLTGIGGRILGYLHTLRVRVGGKRFRLKVIFSREFTVSLNILGRDNFFLPFFVTFAERKKKVVITVIDD